MEHPWTGGLSFPNDIALGPLDDPGYLQKKTCHSGTVKSSTHLVDPDNLQNI